MNSGYEGKLQIDNWHCARKRDSPISARSWRSTARQEAIMVVGHNPNLSQFLGAVISDSGCEASVELEKGRGGQEWKCAAHRARCSGA